MKLTLIENIGPGGFGVVDKVQDEKGNTTIFYSFNCLTNDNYLINILNYYLSFIKMNRVLFYIIIVFSPLTLFSQRVGINTNSIDTSAVFEIKSESCAQILIWIPKKTAIIQTIITFIFNFIFLRILPNR